jgi:transposase
LRVQHRGWSTPEQAAEKVVGEPWQLAHLHTVMSYTQDMRGEDEQQDAVFSYRRVEDRIAGDHPLRRIRAMMDESLKKMSVHFQAAYSRWGRPSIAPERLLRALLLQILYSIRSERQLMEQLDYNLLFRWFVGMNADEAVWDATVFSKNRERLLTGETTVRLLEAVLEQAREHELLSEEHFTVDGTLIQAWAGRKSFVPKDPPPSRGTGAQGRKLLRDRVQSTTDEQARLYSKGRQPGQPSYLGHVLMENRSGLVVAACATQSSQRAERDAALAMLDNMGRDPRRVGPETPVITLGADKGYQFEDFVTGLRQRAVVPHVAEYQKNDKFPNWLRNEERHHPQFAVSQRKRKLVEKIFGWGKGDSLLRQVKLRGEDKVDGFVRLLAAAVNLVRMVKLIPAG